MTQRFPLSPEELAISQAYWTGQQSVPIGPPAPPAPSASVPGPPPASGLAPGGADQLPPELQAQLEGRLGVPAPPPPVTSPPVTPEWTGEPIQWAGLPGQKAPQQLAQEQAAQEQAAQEQAAQGPPQGGGAVPPAHATPVSGGGGGDAGVSRRVRDAREVFYSTFPAEQQNIQDLATVEGARSDAIAAGTAVLANARVQDAERLQVEAAAQERQFKAYQEDIDRQLAAVRERQVEPSRMFADGGAKAMALVGGLLGGIYQGINKLQSNPFIDQMNRVIERDIAIQEREIERDAKTALEKRNLLGEMRAQFKDKNLATLQAKNLYYEGLKEMIAAEAATYDAPAIQARANQGITGVERQQRALKLQDAMREAAQAAAAQAWRRAQAQRAFENMLKYEEMVTHRLKAMGEGRANDKMDPMLKRFVATGTDPQTGGVTGYLARDAASAEHAEKQIKNLHRLLTLVARAEEIRGEIGTAGRAASAGVRPHTFGLWEPEWQTRIRSLENQIGGAIKESEALGALDNGVERFLEPISGKLDSVGGRADDKLRELKAATQEKLDALTRGGGGQQVLKLPGEQVLMMGGVNSPINPQGSQGVRREAP